MKNIVLTIMSLFTILALNAQPPSVPAEKGTFFGEKFTAGNAVSVTELVSQLQKLPADKKKVEVQLKANVTDVCTKEGCWIKIKGTTDKFMVKMKDHKFTVPLVLNEKEIIINGIAEEKTTSVEMLQHYAEDAGKTKTEIAAIKEPKKEIVIVAKGILVN
jgi:hypothetical protein